VEVSDFEPRWVRNQFRGSAAEVESADDSDSSKSGAIEIRDDFAHQRAQLEVNGLVGDSLVLCSVIESDNGDFVGAQYLNFRREFVPEQMRDNY
jgi:hypothetical protein